MRSMLSVDYDDTNDEDQLAETIAAIKECIISDCHISLADLHYIEELGMDINEVISRLEKEINGDSEVYYSGWGS